MDNVFPPGADVKVWNRHGDHSHVKRVNRLSLMMSKSFMCARCDYRLNDHGSIEHENSYVCPGDFIVRGSDGNYHSFHPEVIAKGVE